MEFNWRSPHFTRLAILVVTVLVLGIIVGSDNRSYLAIAGLLIAIAFQISLLIKLIESNQNAYSVFSSIQFDDVLGSFKTTSSDLTALRFRDELNDAVTKLRISKKEKERDSEYQFFKNIVQHVGIGILTFKKDGSILLINSAAKRLLHVSKADTIDELREMSEPLVEAFLKLKTGGRELVLLKYGDDDVQLSIFAIELTLRGEVVKLISMNNIKTELEEKEMEAWQNLVRVLTHEIMNSVTPISSLAGVVEEELNQQLKGSTEVHLKKEAAEDMHLSLQTISRRSEGLIRFVKEFRNLTQIPQPRLVTIQVKNLLDEMAMLHKKELADKHISISVSVVPEDLTINVDKSMIEQVLINLIKNAIQAFDKEETKNIHLSGFLEEDTPAIVVRDNGSGIDEEALEKIFIPFFSTKKTGSGIGLSLSKQIMRKHEGRISVKSKLGEGTEFSLRF